MKDRYLCKKSAILFNQPFEKNNIYEVMEIQYGPTIVMNHIYFYCGPGDTNDFRPYIYDYFFTQVEERKFKLKQLQKNL